MTIRRGQWLTSYSKIAAALGLSKKQVRLSIDKLKRTQEVRTSRARDGAQCGLLINVEKYSIYQSNENEEGHGVWYHKGHDEGTTRAPNKNEKNEKNIKVSKDHKNLSNLWLMIFKTGCVCVFCISLNSCLQYALRCLM